MAKKQEEDHSVLAKEIASEIKAPRPPTPLVEAVVEDADRIHLVASEIVRGTIAIDQVSNLNSHEREKVRRLVEEMIALKSDPATRRQQGSTPYYNPSGSKIIKDGR